MLPFALANTRAGIIASGICHRRGSDDGNAVRDGVPRLPVDLFSRGIAGQSAALCHGEFDRWQEVVPELVQQDFTAENVVARLRDILPDEPKRDQMIAGLTEVKGLLGYPQADGLHPAERAAEAKSR